MNWLIDTVTTILRVAGWLLLALVVVWAFLSGIDLGTGPTGR